MLPDPNMFTGRIAYVKPLGSISDADRDGQQWIEIEPVGPVTGRGIGVLDMARAIAEGRPNIATGELRLPRARRHALGAGIGRRRSDPHDRVDRGARPAAAGRLRPLRRDALTCVTRRG